ncbi:SDR family oxidoreductase [Polyangium aurulentum]|uniref:SDR family oxidoreductase n=1 Tax=Polyangium aurulentum TaxID=2567896 RepID=UPI0010ADC733|nr:SDR family oxidoreductase [Polyangium aurulentum]UQA56569.1 SDR family oxidoreductase [Polyangium aurulentum]
MDMAKKVALVIGGSGGIGKASALAFGQAGVAVVVAARREEAGEAVAKAITDAGGRARFVRCDLNSKADVEGAVGTAVSAFGRLDYAVNVPGITGTVGPLVECSDETWESVLHMNLTGIFWSMRAQIRQMLAQGEGGAIVNISSAVGKRAFAGLGVYGATKRAMESLTETAALEYARQNIRVNAIAPGSIETDTFYGFTNGGDPQLVKAMAETYHPLARIGRPEEVAQAVLYLCTGATFTTGATLPVDGGWAFRP